MYKHGKITDQKNLVCHFHSFVKYSSSRRNSKCGRKGGEKNAQSMPGVTPATESFLFSSSSTASYTKRCQLLNSIPGNNQINMTSNKSSNLWKLECMPSCWVRRGKNERIQHAKGVSSNICSQKLVEQNSPIESLSAIHVASDLFNRHMQSGHGKVYGESFGLFSSYPLESLWDRILSICRLKLLHLGRKGKRNVNLILPALSIMSVRRKLNMCQNEWYGAAMLNLFLSTLCHEHYPINDGITIKLMQKNENKTHPPPL